MQTFTSKQAYTQIKGHYIPITLESVGDESAKDLEKRKYYIANYTFIMKGLLIDEEEFQISPAISRQVTMFEVDTKTRGRRVTPQPPRPNNFDLNLTFVGGVTQLSEVYRYTVDLKIGEMDNVSSYSVFLNGNYVGDNLTTIQITDGDTFLITVTKIDNTQSATIYTTAYLV
jgi:hypothetical protein